MDGPTLSTLPPFNTIGYAEKINVLKSLRKPLSGYLGGGTPRGGYWTDRLESEWTAIFGCKYAIPCNSATSGLLAACMAAGVGPGDEVWTTPYSMSATAACAMVLGATVRFIDIEPVRYSINLNNFWLPHLRRAPKAVIVTNLFGHPAYLATMRTWCDSVGAIMIEDSAQSILAKEGKKYAGTVGHMGVFSLNVHKHIQCGEGGVVVTDDSSYSARLRGAINHGELQSSVSHVGLNLRMTEPTAAIACAQLMKVEEIVRGRRRIAHAITRMMISVPWVGPPIEADGCTHSYYVWAGTIPELDKRGKFIRELNLRGFPVREGYSRLLTEVFDSEDRCPEAFRIEHQRIFTYEVCAYDPKAHHLKRMEEIVDYVTNSMARVGKWKSQAAE